MRLLVLVAAVIAASMKALPKRKGNNQLKPPH